MTQRPRVPCLSAEGGLAGDSISAGAGAFCSRSSEFGGYATLPKKMNLTSVGAGAAAAAASPARDQSVLDLSAPAAATAVSTSADDTGSTGAGAEAHAVPPAESGSSGSDCHMTQTDIVGATNLTDGAAQPHTDESIVTLWTSCRSGKLRITRFTSV
eukprot:SAG22_NODE_858_length_6831_cov_25.965538_6_plen_157_part_00